MDCFAAARYFGCGARMKNGVFLDRPPPGLALDK